MHEKHWSVVKGYSICLCNYYDEQNFVFAKTNAHAYEYNAYFDINHR